MMGLHQLFMGFFHQEYGSIDHGDACFNGKALEHCSDITGPPTLGWVARDPTRDRSPIDMCTYNVDIQISIYKVSSYQQPSYVRQQLSFGLGPTF